MDSLRYWVTECTSTASASTSPRRSARELLRRSTALSAFFDAIHQDPVLSPVEADRRALGRRARAATRSANFPGAGPSGTAATATRCALLARARPTSRRVRRALHRLERPLRVRRAPARPPRINFVTAHDGFTLADLVSYNEKHNEANGEDNRDGTDDNRSWNCGVEGPTDDPAVNALRERQQRNFLATLLLSQGVAHARWRATRSGARSTATTTRTARTTRSRGSTGSSTTGARICSSSRAGC